MSDNLVKFTEFEFNVHQWSEWMGRWNTGRLFEVYHCIHEYLMHGEHVRIGRGNRHFQIIIAPSWEPTLSYELFSTVYISKRAKGVWRHLLLKTSWDEEAEFKRWKEEKAIYKTDFDLQKVDKKYVPTPRFDFQWVGLERNEVEELGEILTIDLTPKFDPLNFRTGNDGTFFELSFGNRFLGTRFNWWSMSPDDWAPLQTAVNEAIEKMEELLENPLSEKATSVN